MEALDNKILPWSLQLLMNRALYWLCCPTLSGNDPNRTSEKTDAPELLQLVSGAILRQSADVDFTHLIGVLCVYVFIFSFK